MRMKLFWSLLVSAACMCSATNLAAKSDAIDSGYYTEKDKEFYLTPEQLLFIRPGLELEILSVVIPADRKTEVTFKLSDPAGLPLDRTGVNTPGPVSTSFILAYIPEGEEAYLSYTTYIQTSPITDDSSELATSDRGGVYTEVGEGTYLYKFATVLPTDYEVDSTTTVGVYARRDLTEFELDRYVTNELEHFVPSGMYDPVPRDIVTTETCNGRCHDPIALHGGARTDVGLCILCHNPNQDIDPDTGNSIDMPLMIHKIHMGAQLENGYNIIGYRQTDHDYSEVVYPAEIIECESCHTGGTPTTNFPMVASPNPTPVCDSSKLGITELSWDFPATTEIRVDAADGPLFGRVSGEGSTETTKWITDGIKFFAVDYGTGETIQEMTVNTTALGCVNAAPGTFVGEAGMDHTNWLDNPTRKTCGSCHDWVNFETGEGHGPADLAVSDDQFCHKCHEPFGQEFGPSVAGSHLPLYKSAQLPGVIVKFVEVMDTNPGDTPTVVFSLGSKNALLDPASLNRLNLVLSGPNEDWSFYASETVGDAAVAMGDYWAYTFETALPDDALGSFTVSMEGRALVDVDMVDEISSERDYAQNPVMEFKVTDEVAVPRRMVVDEEKCESCHLNISLHGGNRRDVQYCNTCHMPSLIDIATPEAANVSMKWMIHKIHRGAELENGYVVVRSRGTYDFSEIEFTGDLRNCDACHVNNSQQLSLPEGVLPAFTPNQWWDPIQPQAAACVSCHDGDDAMAHAYSNTAIFGESCTVCHGEGKEASVDKVHAK